MKLGHPETMSCSWDLRTCQILLHGKVFVKSCEEHLFLFLNFFFQFSSPFSSKGCEDSDIGGQDLWPTLGMATSTFSELMLGARLVPLSQEYVLQPLKDCVSSLSVCLSGHKRPDLWNDEGSIGCIPGLKNLIPSCLKFHHHCLPFNHVLLLKGSC